MNPIFADTFYWIALLNRREEWHERAVAFSRTLGSRPLITTEWILTEFLAFFSGAGETARQRAAQRTRHILNDPNMRVLSSSEVSFLDGLDLYECRQDKQYSLVDCISMQTMRRDGLTEILTNDRHFTQEGFQILFQ